MVAFLTQGPAPESVWPLFCYNGFMECPICHREAMRPSSGSKAICLRCHFVQSLCEAEPPQNLKEEDINDAGSRA